HPGRARAGAGFVRRGGEIRPFIAASRLRPCAATGPPGKARPSRRRAGMPVRQRSEEHTSELQSRENLVCRLLLEKKKKKTRHTAMLSKRETSHKMSIGLFIMTKILIRHQIVSNITTLVRKGDKRAQHNQCESVRV